MPTMKTVTRITLIAMLAATLFLSLAIIHQQPTIATSDPLNVNVTRFWVDVSKNGGQQYLQLYATNKTNEPINASLSLWDRYMYPPNDYEWIPDSSWLPNINPTSITLAPGESALFSISANIPPDMPELSYITWLKLSDGRGWEKPITIAIRIGKAVPQYSFSLSTGSWYHIKVTDYGAYATADTPFSECTPIGIYSKCPAVAKFQAIIEQPKSNDHITQERIDDPTSALFYGLQDELGNTYIAVPADQSSTWLTLSATENDPLIIQPYAAAYIPWTLTIPDSLPDGCYLIHVRIKPAEPTNSTINIEYLSQFYIKVDRAKSNFPWLIPLATGIAGIGIIIVVRKVAKRHSRNQSSNGESSTAK